MTNESSFQESADPSPSSLCDMDQKFHPAQRAMATDDLPLLKSILDRDPSLVLAESSQSHPRLLNCLVLQSPIPLKLAEMIKLLASYGAELSDPLTAASSMNHVEAMQVLLDLGANVEGASDWSSLEEAIYWGHPEAIDLLLRRGALINNLRKAAALGRFERVASYFSESGTLLESAGVVNWPFGVGLSNEARCDPNNILDNAMVHAAASNQAEIVRFLLDRGARINQLPVGFDFDGTALHYAALRGHDKLVDQLLGWGADPTVLDGKVAQPPDRWAAHDNHHALAEHLRAIRENHQANL